MKTLTVFCGSWLRAITTAIIATNLVAIGLALTFLIQARETLFRIDAVSDAVSFVTTSDLEWGSAPLRALEGAKPLCEQAGVKVPAATSVRAVRSENGVSVALTATLEHPVIVKCGNNDDRPVTFVELWFAAPSFPSTMNNKPVTSRQLFDGLRALKSDDPPRAAIPVAGNLLRVGGQGDPDSPLTDVTLLRSGTLSSETLSLPLRSSSVIVDRPLQTGDIVSFDQPLEDPAGKNSKQKPGFSPPFTGILLVEDNHLRIVARTQAKVALVTSPNALEGKAAIVAPTFLARLQAQAEWGVIILIGGLLLGIFGALRALVLEEERMFEWASPPRLALPEPPASPARPQRRKRTRAAKGAAAILLVGSLSLACGRRASAQAIVDHPEFRIQVQGGGFGQGFAILNPRGTPKCLIVTAAHVVRPGDEVTLIGEQPNLATGQASAIRAKARYLDEIAPGIAVLEPNPLAVLGNCAPMPRPARADEAYETDAFGRLTYAADNGERLTVKVVVDGNPGLSRRLIVSAFTRQQISEGMSGSPFSFNGKILALANAVTGGTAELIRLDTADIKPAYIAAAPTTAVQWTPPFDVGRLPKEFADISIAARKLSAEAAIVGAASAANAERGEDAARSARAGISGFGTGRLVEKDRIFEGKIDADGVPSGWGVLRYTDGARVGDEMKGFFRRDGTNFALSGVGVATYADLSKNNGQKMWQVSWNPGANGPGVLFFADGSISWSRWQNGNNNAIETYQRGDDKSGFEVATKEGKMNGPGVRWSTTGQPLCICWWKDGQVVKDETAKFLAQHP